MRAHIMYVTARLRERECVPVCLCRQVNAEAILPVSYFWHGCVVSQAAAQLVNINAVWRSDGDWS